MPGVVLTTLAHHIDVEWLRAAYEATRKDGAVGIDGVEAEAYAADLEGNLRRLLEAFKSGRYRAPAVRGVRIPKADGKSTRAIGIPTFEDKVLQRAVAMVLVAVYEQEFLPCSYGFRPGRSAHEALQALWQATMAMGGGWVLELDLEDFFGSLDHGHLRSFLDRRVRDGVLRRMIDKWLKAGVLEQGRWRRSETGTPQGGVVSPVLANVYLHAVLDRWWDEEVRPRMRGRAVLLRYADDFVMVFEREDDARRVMAVLPKRLARYGLRPHVEKTRLAAFERPRGSGPASRGDRPGSFDFLGFTHYWGRSRKRSWVVKRKTAKDRLRRALRATDSWLRSHRHEKLRVQQAALGRKLQGHYAYYGITGNASALSAFRYAVTCQWRWWLNRRGGRRRMTWERFARLWQRYRLPPVRVVHSIYA